MVTEEFRSTTCEMCGKYPAEAYLEKRPLCGPCFLTGKEPKTVTEADLGPLDLYKEVAKEIFIDPKSSFPKRKDTDFSDHKMKNFGSVIITEEDLKPSNENLKMEVKSVPKGPNPFYEKYKIEQVPGDQGHFIADPPESIHHPSHYNKGKIEVGDFADDQDLSRYCFTALRYMCRAGHKNPDEHVQDIDKAIVYLVREREIIEAKKQNRSVLPWSAMPQI